MSPRALAFFVGDSPQDFVTLAQLMFALMGITVALMAAVFITSRRALGARVTDAGDMNIKFTNLALNRFKWYGLGFLALGTFHAISMVCAYRWTVTNNDELGGELALILGFVGTAIFAIATALCLWQHQRPRPY